MLSRPIAKLQRTLAKYPLAVHAVKKLRNQCNAILGSRASLGSDYRTNGESWLAALISPSATFFVDVGANVGDWSVSFASEMISPKGLAFEPAPETATKLKSRLSEFGLTAIEVAEIALGENIGHMDFFAETDLGETSSFFWEHSKSTAVPKRVSASTLDIELASRGVRFVDFLKIDAEGMDFHVLKGCSSYLTQQRISAIQFEYNSPWAFAGATLYGAVRFLHGLGYEVFILKGPQLFSFDPADTGEFFRYCNLVAYRAGHNILEGLPKATL
jgi:FkbM family methyltransferase